MFSRSVLRASRVAPAPSRSFAVASPLRSNTDSQNVAEKVFDKVMPNALKHDGPKQNVNTNEIIGIKEHTTSDIPPELAHMTDPEAGAKEDAKARKAGAEDLGKQSRTEEPAGKGQSDIL